MPESLGEDQIILNVWMRYEFKDVAKNCFGNRLELLFSFEWILSLVFDSGWRCVLYKQSYSAC